MRLFLKQQICIIVGLLLCLVCVSPVFASQVTLNFPESLYGETVIVTDENGVPYDQKTISATGECIVDLNEIPGPVITFNSTDIPSEGKANGEHLFNKFELLFYLFFTALISVAISFIAGRYSTLRVLKKLRDYIYEKDIDS